MFDRRSRWSPSLEARESGASSGEAFENKATTASLLPNSRIDRSGVVSRGDSATVCARAGRGSSWPGSCEKMVGEVGRLWVAR